jgi:hypothetical protein
MCSLFSQWGISTHLDKANLAVKGFKDEDFNIFSSFCSNLADTLATVATSSLGKELVLYENSELEH